VDDRGRLVTRARSGKYPTVQGEDGLAGAPNGDKKKPPMYIIVTLATEKAIRKKMKLSDSCARSASTASPQNSFCLRDHYDVSPSLVKEPNRAAVPTSFHMNSWR
jgi:hypothetical protein